MKRIFRSALLAAVCLGLFAAPADAAYKKEYKLSVVPGATSGWGLSGTYFADLVRERTNGRINIKVYTALSSWPASRPLNFCSSATVPSTSLLLPPSTGLPR